MISLEINKAQQDKIAKMIESCPKAMKNAVQHWMYSERKRFIGSKSSPMGKFRKVLSRIPLSRGTGPFTRTGFWPKNVVNAFSGRLSGKESIGTMTMKMGLDPNEKHRGDFTTGLSLLSTGWTSSSANAMPLPVYRNLKNSSFEGGIKGGYYKAFQRMAAAGMLYARKMANGTVLWFDKNKMAKRGGGVAGGFKRNALMFVGKRTVTIKKKFDFYGEWAPLKAGAPKRLQMLLLRQVRALEKGYSSEENFK